MTVTYDISYDISYDSNLWPNLPFDRPTVTFSPGKKPCSSALRGFSYRLKVILVERYNRMIHTV